MSATFESGSRTNSADFDPIFHDLINFHLTEFTSEYFTEMFLSYMFGPSVVTYGILRNNRRSRLHAVIDCLFLGGLFVKRKGWGGGMASIFFMSPLGKGRRSQM